MARLTRRAVKRRRRQRPRGIPALDERGLAPSQPGRRPPLSWSVPRRVSPVSERRLPSRAVEVMRADPGPRAGRRGDAVPGQPPGRSPRGGGERLTGRPLTEIVRLPRRSRRVRPEHSIPSVHRSRSCPGYRGGRACRPTSRQRPWPRALVARRHDLQPRPHPRQPHPGPDPVGGRGGGAERDRHHAGSHGIAGGTEVEAWPRWT